MLSDNGPVGVIGAGSWGTTLAHLLAAKGLKVNLWVFEEELCETIRRTGENSIYLPGHRLHKDVCTSIIRWRKWQGQAGCLSWSFLPTYIAGGHADAPCICAKTP